MNSVENHFGFFIFSGETFSRVVCAFYKNLNMKRHVHVLFYSTSHIAYRVAVIWYTNPVNQIERVCLGELVGGDEHSADSGGVVLVGSDSDRDREVNGERVSWQREPLFGFSGISSNFSFVLMLEEESERGERGKREDQSVSRVCPRREERHSRKKRTAVKSWIDCYRKRRVCMCVCTRVYVCVFGNR